MAEKIIRKQSRPEQYLQEIRDLQIQNNQLLKKLTIAEEKKQSRRNLSIIGKTLVILLPYLFSLFVAWAFYAKVQESVGSLKIFITDIPSAVTQMFQDNIDGTIQNAKNKGDDLWQQGVDKWNNR